MELGLAGKVIFITGGSRGIGKAIAQAFLDEGASVAIAARSIEDLELTQTQLGNVGIFQGDLSIASNRERVFHSFLEQYGRIDILINNVGGSNGGRAMETNLSLFEQAMQLNYLSAVHFSQLAAEKM